MTCEPPKHADSVAQNTVLPFEPNIRDTKQWLNDLPIIDGKKSANMILSALYALNGLEMDSSQRFELTEQVLIQVDCLGNFFDKTIIEASFPLRDEVLLSAQLRIRLYKALATGFGKAINPKLKFFFFKRKNLITRSIQRALFCLHKELLYSSLCHQEVDANFWAQTYKLFQVSEKLRLEGIEVTNSFSYPDRTTVNATFRRILLLSLSRPNHYHQREIIQINNLIALLEKDVLIEKNGGDDGFETPLFRFDIDGHQPPECHDRSQDLPSANYRILKAGNAFKSLLNNEGLFRTHANHHKEFGVMPSRRVIVSFVKRLSCPPRRRYTRTELNIDNNFYVGLTTVIEALSRTPSPKNDETNNSPEIKTNNETIRRSDFSTYEIVPLDHEVSANTYKMSRRDLRSEYYIDNLLLNVVYRSSRDVQIWNSSMENSIKNREAHQCSATLINSSAKGYGFINTYNSSIRIKIGEIIGIPKHKGRLEIGVIRWITTVDQNAIIFGVELLSPTAEVVTIHDDDQQKASLKGLLFPGISNCDQPASVVMPSSSFKPGQSVAVKSKGKMNLFKLKGLFEATPSFGHFALLNATFEDIKTP